MRLRLSAADALTTRGVMGCVHRRKNFALPRGSDDDGFRDSAAGESAKYRNSRRAPQRKVISPRTRC